MPYRTVSAAYRLHCRIDRKVDCGLAILRVRGDSDLSPIVIEHDQYEQHPEGRCRHKVRQPCDGGILSLIMYLETTASETLIPGFSSSP